MPHQLPSFDLKQAMRQRRRHALANQPPLCWRPGTARMMGQLLPCFVWSMHVVRQSSMPMYHPLRRQSSMPMDHSLRCNVHSSTRRSRRHHPPAFLQRSTLFVKWRPLLQLTTRRARSARDSGTHSVKKQETRVQVARRADICAEARSGVSCRVPCERSTRARNLSKTSAALSRSCVEQQSRAKG